MNGQCPPGAQVAGSTKGRPRRGMASCGQGWWQRHQKQGKGSGPVPKGQEAQRLQEGRQRCPSYGGLALHGPRTHHLLRMSP